MSAEPVALPDPATDEVALLRRALARSDRRLARERDARTEAESIAERSTRDLYDRQRELELLESVARAANSSRSFKHALRLTLAELCEHLDWPIAQAWLVVEGSDALELSPERYCDDPGRMRAFLTDSSLQHFTSGRGLPGTVLATGLPATIANVLEHTNFPRAASARTSGLHGAVAFPVVVDGEVRAVIECLSHDVVSWDGLLVRVLGQVAEHLARVFERETVENRLRIDATHDPLTNLPNRSLFTTRLAHAIAHPSTAGHVAVALFDLDRFKDVNDTLGHQPGDRLLIQVAERLRQVLRPGDTVARLGGDEFGLVLNALRGTDDALETVRQFRSALAAPITLDGVLIDVDASVGVAVHLDHGIEAEDMVRRAEVAMYDAKRAGTGVRLYDRARDPHSAGRLGMLAALRRAMDRHELALHYQPQVDVADERRVHGVEALVRWHHPERGFVPPDEFIPLAESTGLIHPLTTYVVEAALLQARDWLDQGISLPIAVNISTRSLLDDAFPQEVAGLLDSTGVPASALHLEVTESVMIEDPTTSLGTLTALRDLGLSIAIDDFGTGYSSMAQVKHLPVDEIKIDREFVKEILLDDRDAAIVDATINLAHNLGLDVVAEGVEDEKTLKRLRAMGCDHAQGYHFLPPRPAEELTVWLADRDVPTTAVAPVVGVTAAESAAAGA